MPFPSSQFSAARPFLQRILASQSAFAQDPIEAKAREFGW